MKKYLKDRSYYENLQDNSMIRACKMHEKIGKERSFKDKEKQHAWHCVMNFAIMGTKYNFYKKREEKIHKSMEEDRKRDELFEKSKPFDNKHCKKCNEILECFDKTLNIGVLGKPDKVLFFYKCNNCDFRLGIYHDGTEFFVEPDKCKECKAIIKAKARFEGNILIEEFNCKKCNASYIEKDDYTPSSEKEEDIITDEDREKYGYNAEEGLEIVSSFDGLEELSEIMKEQKEKDKNKDLYEQVKKLEHLNIVGIKKKIILFIEKTPFSDFSIDSNKQVKGGIEIDFTIFYEGNIGDNSKLKLKKLFKTQLQKTNWRLKESSLNEKMGAINGKIVGYDDEDLLIKYL